MNNKYRSQDGQTLITLIFLMVIGIAVISAATLILNTDTASSANSEQGLAAYYAAEGGAEDGILHMLRNPNPTYPLTIPPYAVDPSSQVSVTIKQSGSSILIDATGTNGSAKRIIEVTVTSNSGALNISSWKEIIQ